MDASFPTGHGLGIRRTKLHRLMIERAAASRSQLALADSRHRASSRWCLAGHAVGAGALDCRGGRRSLSGTPVGGSRRKHGPPRNVSLFVATIVLPRGQTAWKFIGVAIASFM